MATNAGFDKNPQNINRDGAPKKEWTWGGLFRELSEQGKGNKEVKKMLAEAMIKKAKEGDVGAFKEIANRTDGLPKQALDLTSDGEALGVILYPKKNDEETKNSLATA